MAWPPELTAYKLLTDWGSLIGGVLALGAGLIAYIGARQAAAKQIAAMSARDRLQAQGIAVAIYPELLKLPDMIGNTRKRLNEIVDQLAGKQPGQFVGATVQGAAVIPIPPMLNRNIDLLFMLGEVAGPACLQLVNLLFQYEALVFDITQRMMPMSTVEWTSGAVQHLQEHLTLLEAVVAKCEHEVRPIHDAIGG
jgi:hypothetical protein